MTLDAGALIAVDRNDRFVVALLARAQELGTRVTIPASVVAQAIRDPARQVKLMWLVYDDATDVVALDRRDATDIGILLAASRTADITDAHVVVCARRAGQPIVTSDPDDLSRLDPNADLIPI